MKFLMYGREGCGYCTRALNLFEERAIAFDYIDTNQPGVKNELLAKNPQATTLPQIFQVSETGEETLIGGYTELAAYLNN